MAICKQGQLLWCLFLWFFSSIFFEVVSDLLSAILSITKIQGFFKSYGRLFLFLVFLNLKITTSAGYWFSIIQFYPRLFFRTQTAHGSICCTFSILSQLARSRHAHSRCHQFWQISYWIQVLLPTGLRTDFVHYTHHTHCLLVSLFYIR